MTPPRGFGLRIIGPDGVVHAATPAGNGYVARCEIQTDQRFDWHLFKRIEPTEPVTCLVCIGG